MKVEIGEANVNAVKSDRLVFTSKEDEYAAFDRLPEPIRRRLASATVPIAATHVADAYDEVAAQVRSAGLPNDVAILRIIRGIAFVERDNAIGPMPADWRP